MKSIALLLWIFLPIISFAQINYSVKGDLGKISPPSKIFLIYGSGKQTVVDSTLIIDHKFKFSGTTVDTIQASLILDYQGKGLDDIWGKRNDDFKDIYLVNGTITVKGNDSLYKATIGGNKLNIDYDKYTVLMMPVMKRLEVAKAGSDYKFAENQRKILSEQYLASNPNSFISLDKALRNIVTEYANPDTIEPIFHSLSKEVRSTKTGVAYQLYINNLKKTSVGAIAPEISQKDTSDHVISLYSFRGKYVLVDFWASWCVPCRYQNPAIVSAYNKYKTKDFVILGVSLDKPGAKGAWMAAIHKDGLSWYQVADLQGWNNSVAVNYGVRTIPQNFLIDPNGKIIAKNLFGDALEKKLGEIFGTM